MSDYTVAWGAYLDTLASAQHMDSFRTNPVFCWDDCMPPPSGFQTPPRGWCLKSLNSAFDSWSSWTDKPFTRADDQGA